MSQQRDYKDTVFLPKTDFPMKAGLPAKEPGILAGWQEAELYEQVRAARAGREKFILHDGPPYANGDMHIGHALNHILKDMVVRTQTLLGKDAPYVPGWDCHGLPIEWKVEEKYRKKKLNKDEVPPKEFRAECRAYAQGWVDVQREQLKRLGIGAAWDRPYLTMDFAAEATIVTELLKFAESGQLYRGAKPIMWSPVEKTALAEAEVEYENITSTQIDVAFEIVESKVPELVGAYAVIWTTTPWTIPVNQALAYGADVRYGLVETGGVPELAGKKFLIARDLVIEFNKRLDAAFGTTVCLKGKGTFLGSDLAGTTVRHPMAKMFTSPLPGGEGLGVGAATSENAEHPHPTLPPKGEGFDARLAEFYTRPRPFLDGSAFVTTESGTGLVHMAPDHGEDDFDLCKAHGIEPVFAVGSGGVYRDDWPWLGGHDDRRRAVINAKFNAPDGPICSDLRDAGGLLSASADYTHSYPHSWRSKAKVIYRCTPQWFVPMDKANDGGATLRELATKAIADTRFVPEKGRNRISAMVTGRPDWVLSRQRAWGVPITLFVDRKSGQYLNDPAVNARIIAAVQAGGVDAWDAQNAQTLLGPDYKVDDYEQITDILDVWFDSGCTHSFVLESGKWPELLRPAAYDGPPADLYLEGSDQHRGWFQSSLLESCATRGHAPYKAVLTHGFTMDAKGMKMSKSLGNTISPLDVMRDYGADIIRLWTLSVDYTEDHRIGPEILKGVADQYRKLRNTFRYLLGALSDFDEAERLPVAQMPELERYMLALLGELDGKLRRAVDDFDFNSYTRALGDFCNEDLSAFFFDIRKDCLYCDAPDNLKRRAYRTVLDTLFHALIRYAAPVLVYTAEEVWRSRYPDAGSVHLLEWPDFNIQTGESPAFLERWKLVRSVRDSVTHSLEHPKQTKMIRTTMEASPHLEVFDDRYFDALQCIETDIAELCLVADFTFERASEATKIQAGEGVHYVNRFSKTESHKCGRCWRHLPDVTEDGALCGRCETVING